MILSIIKERTDIRLKYGHSAAMAKAVDILKQSMNCTPSIPELAKLCNVSVSLLSHQFKKETGYSPMQYIRRERVKAAKELILSGCSVNETSSRLGFKNPFHLSRIFSQVEGKPPIYFRKLANRTLYQA